MDKVVDAEPLASELSIDASVALVVFGTDEAGKPHASSFPSAEKARATKAATLMGMRTLTVETEEHRALASGLPQGRLFESGRAFVPFVRRAVYDRLCVLAGPATELPQSQPVAAMPANATGRSKTKSSAPVLPRNWANVGVGSMVLICEKIMDGWFEAEVI